MMDDTILLATTRKGMEHKIKILYNFGNSHGVMVNDSKTKSMVINGTREEKEPIVCNSDVISYCNMYLYLGSPFTDDGSPTTAIKQHAANKMCHTLKFVSFINRNNDVPFVIKKKIFNAALMSSMLYACESWLNCNIKPIEKQYKWCIKQLLGVRKTTNNDACMVELGIPPLRALIRSKPGKFFKEMWLERNTMDDDPLIHAMRIVLNYDDSISRYIQSLITENNSDIKEAQFELQLKLRNSNSNRIMFYKTINPDLVVHDIYVKRLKVNETERISWTKMQLSAHSLAVETGRWNRRGRGRLPMEERLCSCGQIQTETHVIEDCPVSLQIRQIYNVNTALDLLLTRTDYEVVCKIVHKLLSLY